MTTNAKKAGLSKPGTVDKGPTQGVYQQYHRTGKMPTMDTAKATVPGGSAKQKY